MISSSQVNQYFTLSPGNRRRSLLLSGPLFLRLSTPNDYCAHDTFTFVSEVTKIHTLNKFMVSFDVESLFTNIPLIESIDLAVDYIMKGNPDIKLGRQNLTKLVFLCPCPNQLFLFG